MRPDIIRHDYLRALDAWRTRLSNHCREHRIDYVPLDTRTPYDVALLAYLQKRSRLY